MTLASPPPAAHVNPEIESERRYALRALLRSPLLPAAGETAKQYAMVRRHGVWLRQWLAKFPAWRLHIDAAVARLYKTPADGDDDTRPAVDRTSGAPFSRRRYALLCLALAALERSERQTTLGKIAERIMEFIAADRELQAAGLVFDLSNLDQRRDLVHAVRLLLEYGLLERVHGDEQEFLAGTGASDALYAIHRPLLAVMLNLPGSPSAMEAAGRPSLGPEAIPPPSGRREAPGEGEARNRRIRARLVRAFLDDPVLYTSDLTNEERAYLQRQRGYLVRQAADAAGLAPEVRREGIAMSDDLGDLTDVKLPEEGTDGHVSLLVAEWLAECARSRPGAAVPIEAVEQYVGRLIEIHGARWRKDARAPGAESRLAANALERLRGLRLIRMTADGIAPLAAVGRYGRRRSIDDSNPQEQTSYA